jgi:hypothetical protein
MHQGRGDGLYIPSWTELTISAGVVSVAILVFLFFVERFKVWEDRPVDPEADPTKLPDLHAVGSTWLGVPVVANRTVYSLGFILAAAVGLAFLSPQPANSRGVHAAPVHHARGGDTLRVDGNLDGFGVAFEHETHKSYADDCATCHHMNFPMDEDTGCHQCHRDMYQTSDAFKHDWHASSTGAGLGCTECHAQSEARTADSAVECIECHTDLFPESSPIQVEQYQATGYVSAMHQVCIGCHAEMAEQMGMPEMARCEACHTTSEEFLANQPLPERTRERVGKRLVLPPY